MSGRGHAVARRYCASYTASARSAGKRYSVANSALASTTSAASAPLARALRRRASKSSGCPTSAITAITAEPYVSFSHGMMTEVSRPPLYARTTFLETDMGCLLNGRLRHRCQRSIEDLHRLIHVGRRNNQRRDRSEERRVGKECATLCRS